jgi:hypothetical protein
MPGIYDAQNYDAQNDAQNIEALMERTYERDSIHRQSQHFAQARRTVP